jgi:hypothetical protein
MVFLGIYRAIYDYEPQSSNEIALDEGDILMVLEKSTIDAWWKAKKKGRDGDDEEPEGLIPNNYIEEVCCASPTTQSPAWVAKLYQTQRQRFCGIP